MKQSIRLALVSALALVLCLVPGKYTFADSVSVKPFLAFGADLSTKEKAQVMKQFGITNEELADYFAAAKLLRFSQRRTRRLSDNHSDKQGRASVSG